MTKELLIWCDLETTGLDPHMCDILEIGLVATDFDLNQQGTHFSAPVSWVKYESGLDPYVRKMHTDNGLLSLCKQLTTGTCYQVENRILEWWANDLSLEKDVKPILCGSSIHFDRGFLKEHMPRFEKLLHYRMVDVSTLKTLNERWGYWPAAKKALETREPSKHRVLGDIADSIQELKWYRRDMLYIRGEL